MVSIEEINKVWKHPNADALDLASVSGMSFQFIVGRNEVKVGDKVVYFPIDSILPPKVLEVLPEVIVKKLQGKEKNRVKTAKLRGEISQGLAFKLESFPLEKFGVPFPYNLSQDITSYLGVEKYEAPIVSCGGYDLHPLPALSPYYDIEGCDRYGNVLETLLNKEVVITEKLEGSNLSVVCEYPEMKIRICQRSGEIIPLEGSVNSYHEGAKLCNLPEIAKEIAKEYHLPVTIRGELIGPSVQGNIYNLKQITVYCFEIWLNGKPIDWLEQNEIEKKYNLKTVPILFKGLLKDYLGTESVQKKSNGTSVLNPKHLREGIVIRPTKELPEILGFGRLILKQRSPEYLAKTDN